MGFRGFNCTIPHKVAVLQYLDRTSEAASLMGAVNCVNRVGDELVGENTDGKGFIESLRTICDPAGKRIVVLGAGGAARAISVELGLGGAAEITIVNRDPGRGYELVDLITSRVHVASTYAPWPDPYEVPAETDVVINATSIGLGDADARVPVDFATLSPQMVVADVIFNPADTRFLREARNRGCRTLDGLGMLVNQAVIGFKIWTGVQPDAELMREALEEFLGI
jgi:shikimate dehydrogenase